MLVARRAPDFAETGTYLVDVGDRTVQVYRDTEDGTWYYAGNVHWSLTRLGYNKQEALERLERLAGMGKLKLNPPKFNAAFKAWFKNSQVVDKNGQPLVVYHGTRAPEFTEFDTGGEHGNLNDVGAHFGTIDQANSRLGFSKEVVRDAVKHGMQAHQFGARVVPVYLSLQNPITLPDIDEWNNPDQWIARLAKIPADVRDDIRVGAVNAVERFENGEDLGFADEAKEILQYHGYDGIKYLNKFESRKKPDWSWVAFKPEQIKSVNNCGTWSQKDPDIRHNPRTYFDAWVTP